MSGRNEAQVKTDAMIAGAAQAFGSSIYARVIDDHDLMLSFIDDLVSNDKLAPEEKEIARQIIKHVTWDDSEEDE